jgi:hypothetical protein
VQDEQLTVEIEEQLRGVKAHFISHDASGMPDPGETFEDTSEFASQESGEEYFTALINTLPGVEQEIYLGYGDSFREGYVKLNQGYFEDAVKLLTHALVTGVPIVRAINEEWRAKLFTLHLSFFTSKWDVARSTVE